LYPDDEKKTGFPIPQSSATVVRDAVPVMVQHHPRLSSQKLRRVVIIPTRQHRYMKGKTDIRAKDLLFRFSTFTRLREGRNGGSYKERERHGAVPRKNGRIVVGQHHRVPDEPIITSPRFVNTSLATSHPRGTRTHADVITSARTIMSTAIFCAGS
jgi:hypothetical protein